MPLGVIYAAALPSVVIGADDVDAVVDDVVDVVDDVVDDEVPVDLDDDDVPVDLDDVLDELLLDEEEDDDDHDDDAFVFTDFTVDHAE